MWIGLLGALIVRMGPAELRITARNERTVLAALATAQGRPVPADVIAEAIWDDRPPASWRTAIRVAVSKLRSSLGPAGLDLVATAGSGYQLRDAGVKVDIRSFEAGCADGHAAASAGDWTAASAGLRETLKLWRGAPFADIDSRYLRDNGIAYLTHAHVAALMTRVEADLRLLPCRATALVPELHRLNEEYPLHERFRSQLMLALYRTGRQADALAEYRTARRMLRDELGVDPGGELATMHARILHRDPGLDLCQFSRV
jgi:DNA-binding SARP family transcriptional activator